MPKPMEYDEAIAAKICERIMQGRALSDVAKDDDVPGRNTIYKWLAANEAFANNYARAMDVRADAVFDELFQIADEASNDWMERKGDDGQTLGWKENGEAINRSRLRVDVRKWALARMAPKKYGDKLDLNHGGSVTVKLPDYTRDL